MLKYTWSMNTNACLNDMTNVWVNNLQNYTRFLKCSDLQPRLSLRFSMRLPYVQLRWRKFIRSWGTVRIVLQTIRMCSAQARVLVILWQIHQPIRVVTKNYTTLATIFLSYNSLNCSKQRLFHATHTITCSFGNTVSWKGRLSWVCTRCTFELSHL
jgi:hypothetical protein